MATRRITSSYFRRAVENMTARDHHLKLENWILANFCNAFNREGIQRFEWTRRCTSTDCEEADQPPDYMIATQPDSTPQLVEVTEVLDPGRERQREYREILEKVERFGIDFAVRGLPDTPGILRIGVCREGSRGAAKKVRQALSPGHLVNRVFQPPAARTCGRRFALIWCESLSTSACSIGGPGQGRAGVDAQQHIQDRATALKKLASRVST